MEANPVSAANFTEKSRQDVRPAGLGNGMRRKTGERPRTVPIDRNSVVIMQAKSASPLDIIDLTSNEVMFPPQKRQRLDLSCTQRYAESNSLDTVHFASPEAEDEVLTSGQVHPSFAKETSDSTHLGVLPNRPKSSFSEGMHRSAFTSEFRDHDSTSFNVYPHSSATGSSLFYIDDSDGGYDSFSVNKEDLADSSTSPEEKLSKEIISMHGLVPTKTRDIAKTHFPEQSSLSAIKHVNDIAVESVKARTEQSGVEKSKSMREIDLSRMSGTTGNRHLTNSFLEDSKNSPNLTHAQWQLRDLARNESSFTADQKDYLSASTSSGTACASPQNRDWQSKPALSDDACGSSEIERLLDVAQDYATRKQQSGGQDARFPTHLRSNSLLNSCKGTFTDSLDLGLGGNDETRSQSTRPVREQRSSGEHSTERDADTFNLRKSMHENELESGARRLRKLTKLSQKQKTVPKTIFASHDRPHSQRRETSPATLSTRKISQGKRHVEAPGIRNLNPFTDEKEEVRDSPTAPPCTAVAPLATSHNVSGGLALWAQNAASGQSFPENLDETASPSAKKVSSSQRHWTTEMLEIDFSRFRREPTKKEKDTIIEHKRLKDRQRDLKTLKQAIHETAKLSCITGFTDVMETEMKTVDEFAKVVLHSEKLGGYKRNRVTHIKDNMIRRQKGRVVAETDIEAALHLMTDPANLRKIESETARVEEQIEVIVSHRRVQSNNRGKETKKNKTQAKKVRFAAPEYLHTSGGVEVLDSTALDVDANLPELASTPLKRSSSAAYRSRISEIGIRREEAKEAFWKKKLKEYDDAQNRLPAGSKHISQASSMEGHSNRGLLSSPRRPLDEQLSDSEVSEEEDGSEQYPDPRLRNQHPQMTTSPFAADLAQDESSNEIEDREILAEDVIDRLEVERQTEQVNVGVSVPQFSPYKEQASAQAADVGLAQAMHRRRLGIRKRGTSIESESDASEDSNPAECQIYEYTVWGTFYGFEGFEADEEVILGTFLKKTDAQAQVIQNTTDCYKCYFEAKSDTGQDCDMKSTWRRGLLEQTLELPRAGCRVWVKQKLTTAKYERRYRKAAQPVSTYAVRFEKTISWPGKIETLIPTYDEVKLYSALELANAEAVRVMVKWYGTFFKDGFLAMQEDELSSKLDGLAEGELFEWSDDYTRYNEDRPVDEKMRVWVEEKKAIGPRN